MNVIVWGKTVEQINRVSLEEPKLLIWKVTEDIEVHLLISKEVSSPRDIVSGRTISIFYKIKNLAPYMYLDSIPVFNEGC